MPLGTPTNYYIEMTTILASLFSDDRLTDLPLRSWPLALFFWYFATDFRAEKTQHWLHHRGSHCCFQSAFHHPKGHWGNIITGKTASQKLTISKAVSTSSEDHPSPCEFSPPLSPEGTAVPVLLLQCNRRSKRSKSASTTLALLTSSSLPKEATASSCKCRVYT